MTEHTWGPWISHDQSGCPVPDGTIVEVDITGPVKEAGVYVVCIGVDWHNWDRMDEVSRSYLKRFGKTIGVIKYRIRKPRGMKVIDEIMNDIKVPETEMA